MQAPTRMSIDAVRAPVYYVDNTPSTLDVAASLLADTTIPTPHLTTIIADRQSAGRGRLGRSWVTPPGQALLASTIVSLPVSLPADALGWIVHACALSVREALATRLEPLGHAVSLKWPNDVLVDGARKICGILAQLAPASSPFTTAAILGYGVNIGQERAILPTAQATSLAAEGDQRAGEDPTGVAHELLGQILAGLDQRISSLVATETPSAPACSPRPRPPCRSSARASRWPAPQTRPGRPPSKGLRSDWPPRGRCCCAPTMGTASESTPETS